MAPRGKIVLARINNESKRNVTLRKRRSGLVKKVSELATLCDVEAAVVIYNPGENETTVWPSTSEARATFSKSLSRPELERTENSRTAKSFMKKKCKKKENKAQRLIKMNDERNIQVIIKAIEDGKTKIQDLDSEHKEKLQAFADEKKKKLLKLIQKHKGKGQQTPHSPQVFPPALQMPPAGQAASGLNMNGLAAGRNFPSPAAAHDQLNVSVMTPLSPLPFSLPRHNALVMSPNNSAANRFDMSSRLHGQTNLGGMMQRAPHPPQVLRPAPALQMPMVSHVTRGLNMNGFAASRNVPSLAAAAHGKHINLTGMTQGGPPLPLSLPTANPLVMSNPPPSPLSMPPALSTGPIVFSAGGVQDVTDDRLIQRGLPQYMPLEMPRRLGLPPTHYKASGSKNMIRNDHRWDRNGFPRPATAPLDRSNSDDGTSIGIWIDGGSAYEVNNAPPFTVRW